MRKEGRPLPCCPLPSTWVSPRDLGARRLLSSALLCLVSCCITLLCHGALLCCGDLLAVHFTSRVVHRPQSVSPGAAGKQSSWRAEHRWSDTTPGLLCHMTAVGLKSAPRNSPNTKQRQVQRKLCWISPHWWEWTTAHQEEERCIEWKLTM